MGAHYEIKIIIVILSKQIINNKFIVEVLRVVFDAMVSRLKLINRPYFDFFSKVNISNKK